MSNLKKKNKTLKLKIILMSLAIIVFASSSLSVLVYLKTSKTNKETVINTVENKVDVINEILNSLTSKTVSVANLLTSSPAIKSNTTPEEDAAIYSQLEMYQKEYPEIVNILFSRYDRTYIYPSTPEVEAMFSGYAPPETPWYVERSAEEANGNWDEAYIDDATGKWIITYYQKVFENGKHIGFIEIDVALDHIQELVNNIHISDHSSVLVADKAGLVSMSTVGELQSQEIPYEDLLNFVKSNESGHCEYSANSENRFAVMKPITGVLPWNVIATLPSSELNADSISFLKYILVSALLIAALSIAASVVMSERIVKNIRKFNENLNQLGQGDLTTYCTISSNDELSEMCDVFNDTIENIRNLIKSTQDTCANLLEGFSDMSHKSKENTQAINLIVESIQDIAEGASAQASETTRMVNHFGELSGAMKYIDKSIVEANEMVESTNKINESGMDVVNNLLKTTNITNESNNKVSDSIMAISETSSQIDAIVKNINAMAEEAKKVDSKDAGTASNAIKKLVNDFSKSANEVNTLISRVKEQSKIAVNEMETAKENTKTQTDAVKETQNSFEALHNDITKLNKHVNNVGVLNTNMIKIKNTMTDIIDKLATKADLNSEATQSISAMTEEQLATMLEIDEHLSKLTNASEYLKKEISKFKTKQ